MSDPPSTHPAASALGCTSSWLDSVMAPRTACSDGGADGDGASPGDSAEALHRPELLVAALGRYLLRLWELKPGEDAVSVAPQRCVEAALADLEHRLSEPSDWPNQSPPASSPYSSLSHAEIAATAARLAQRLEPLAGQRPVHGTFRLSQCTISNGDVVDWGPSPRSGIGDRYVDLSSISADLGRQLGPWSVAALFDACGIEQPEPIRLEFWALIQCLM